VQIFEPNLDLLRQAFGNSIQDCHAELIKVALGWSRVYRVTLSRQGHSTRESVIVKTIDPNGPAIPLEAERELRFYQFIQPELCIPKPEVYFLTTDQATGFHVIVMEDLSRTHHFPTHPYQWSRLELGSVLRAYARLHTSQIESLDYEWLAPRHESQLNFEKIPEQVATVQRAGIWGELHELPKLIEYARESCKKYANEKLILLHGDTTPANSALPQNPDSQAATLIDWQDVGVGMPEFDLAYLDLQPFESARLIPRSELLDLTGSSARKSTHRRFRRLKNAAPASFTPTWYLRFGSQRPRAALRFIPTLKGRIHTCTGLRNMASFTVV